MRIVPIKNRAKAFEYFNGKINKLLPSINNVKLTHIILTEPTDKECGSFDIIYKDNNNQYYDYHYFRYINMNDEIYLSIGDDDFHKIDLNEELERIKKHKPLAIIKVE